MTGLGQSTLGVCLPGEVVVIVHLFDPDGTLDRVATAEAIVERAAEAIAR